VDLPALSGTLRLATPALGREPVVAPVSGSLRGSWAGGGSGSMKLGTTLEGSAVQASVDLEDWSRRRFRFALAADRLDLDRYLPPPAPAGAKVASGGAQGGGGVAPAPATAQRSLIDLARLQHVDVAGTARIGSLAVRGLKVEKLDLGVRARDGRIDIQPLAAALYGGTTSGRASLDAGSRRWHLAQQLNGVQVGPFLRAAARLDRFEGRGNATVDLEATGLTAEALVRSLRGTARFQLADGAVKGVDLAELLRQASIALGSKSALEREGRAGDRTAFSELAASFVIRDGVATTQDVVFRSEAAKASGGGRLDLVAGTVDYRLDATLLGVSADIRNRVIARIGEVSVPLRITGPIESPKYSVDLGGFAAAAAANELNRRLQGGNDGRKDPVRDLLRGLFGK
jgi:AsmA protein